MGAKHFRTYDILGVIILKAEKLGIKPDNPGKMGIPYNDCAKMLRDGHRIDPATVLKYVAIYEKQSLVRRLQGRPLVISIHGNAWEKIKQILRLGSKELDKDTLLYQKLVERFGELSPEIRPEVQAAARARVPTTEFKREQTKPSQSPVGQPEALSGAASSGLDRIDWTRILEAVGVLLEIFGQEVQKISKTRQESK
jgi:hypothetical protein